MDNKNKNEETSNVVEEAKEPVKKAHFFVLKVLNINEVVPKFLLVKCLTKEDAKNYFANMSPKHPITIITDYNIVDIYDVTSRRDMEELLQKHGDEQFTFYIKRTKIDTYYPYTFTRKIKEIKFRSTNTVFGLYPGKLCAKDQKAYNAIEDKLQMQLATTNSTTYFWNKTSNDDIIQLIRKNGENLAIVIFEETIANTIKLMKNVYKNMQGAECEIDFFYAMGSDLYQILLDDEFKMIRV